jgi:nitrite reductase/ring-hydroxylating ferredoxin subunit
MNDVSFSPTLRLAEVAPGRMRSCKVGERDLVLCHTREGVFALHNLCTHAFARLSEGFLRGTRLTCPLHAAVFDVRDGRALSGPTRESVATYPTRIVDGVIQIGVPPPSSP